MGAGSSRAFLTSDSGGTEIVSGGTDSGAIVLSGGKLEVSAGSGVNATIACRVSQAGLTVAALISATIICALCGVRG